MKIGSLFLIAVLFFSCTKKSTSDNTETGTHETVSVDKQNSDWQAGFNLTHDIDVDSINGKPVRFYVKNKKCHQLAIDFYYGKYRPTDEERTDTLLSLAVSEDNDLRPFYRWILNKTILIADGALGEYTGVPAREYAEKFPEEFFEYMEIDKSNEKYNFWTESIQYSGFYDTDDYKNPEAIRKQLISTMVKNSNKDLKKRITKFALDCFPNKSNLD
ncbi:hypothetical protein [Flavobacterium sangjuense]|uniref:Lipoprotein n=1 Tax=Flavobacterium sangjuense TaxID=2518177 RepID=A0A4P7PSQ8_9FLAO|nr:hypothetical protein [Flavobacterium sangjuense]QBZ97182.1 hypothetical protein GS03_00668 [Flavobacterium sangjuense]